MKKNYPIVALRDGIVFPDTENALLFGRDKSVKAIQDSLKDDKKLVIVMQRNSRFDDPKQEDLYEVGVLTHVQKVLEGDKGEISALIKGESRVRIVNYTQDEPYMRADVEEMIELADESDEINALVRHINAELKKAVNLGKGIDVVFLMNIMSGSSSKQFSEQVAMILDLKTPDRQELLEETDLLKRLKIEADMVSKEVKILEIEKNIHLKTQKKFEKGMKDAVLREKLKTIEQELGSDGSEDREITELKRKIKKVNMSKEAEEKAMKELKRLAQMSQYNPEASYIRTYLEVLVDLPWSEVSKGEVDIKKAQKILDKDHYGLKKAKERIIEYLAVMKLKKLSEADVTRKDKNIKQPTILCFSGPPGVGKTSLGRSIARALGREFIKVSLGGIRDEAEIRGHRRTYVGALPGRMIQGIRQAKTKNPVFMLDEIDKLGRDYRGDPSSALLEALDPEQNHAFSDHYLEVPFDLSEVMFVTTANVLDTIPSALRDRLETIQFPGYTEEEKFHIAKDYLVGKQVNAHGLDDKKVTVTENALKLIIQRYTREAGVRELERQIASCMRKVARDTVENNLKQKSIGVSDIAKYLGAFKYSSQVIDSEDVIGVSTGLAVTQVGGDILSIEVGIMPGSGKLTLTGQLGDVMKESCQAALSYIRSRWELFKIPKDFYSSLEIHIHVPEGAVPKDGPSAGLAIATAMVSALTNIPVNRYVAMTGEITLRGRALEIGGVKSKLIAAHRAGIKTIILPRDNKKDLEDIPQDVLDDLKIVFVDHVDEVLKEALMFPKKKFQFPQSKFLYISKNKSEDGNGATIKN
ncbi:endopeptidase La [Candidatus Roizmanbacteria bacterium RIFCSPHIGHO2_12_FULL_44_10]|uniref:Lon protease n=1 Tax=Candidatus Roizmanbacteria bacterium RIFCSPHIGHO2_12_FULL_44_10 TaxID=1802054 RepID=A0A1F7I9Q2_9BACT|nr:MAG: endopeptidase La [Candidatus Roizmanbacteria bacterium RIFCSPHIGHO2_12_FULL_44_10]